jgi:ABC-type transporter Mla subunit MlaD
MSDEAKVGLLVVLALAVFVTAFLYVANVQLTGSTAVYRTYFAYVGGLDEGSVVRYGGRKAGTVRAVRPWQEDMTKTEVLFEMRAEIPVNVESVATIASLNALGQNYLEVMPGSITAARVEPGGAVPSAEALTFSDLTRKVAEVADGAVALMARIDDKMSLVADDMHAVLVNLRELSSDENRRNIARMLENSNNLIETQAPKIDRVTTQLVDTLDEVERLAEDFRQVARGANATLESVNRAVDATRGPLADSLAQLEGTLADARLVLADARALLLVNEGNVAEIVDNFRRASEDIAALSAELRQRPWTLLRVKPQPDRQVPATAPADAPSR